MDLAAYRQLRLRARAHARVAGEAEDLLQSALLAAVEAGRLDDPAWIEGTLRQLSALQARSAIRRRAREQALADAVDADAPSGEPADARTLLARLPPAARRVAVLALHGLDGEEIRWILGIAPTAFRQRLSRIRRVLGELGPAQRREALALAYVRDPARVAELQFGLVRRALKAALAVRAGLGTHDPDGHLLVLHGAHGSAPGGNDPAGPHPKEDFPCLRTPR